MFLNSLSVVAVLLFLIVYVGAYRANSKYGMSVHEVPGHICLGGLVGLLWLVFGGA